MPGQGAQHLGCWKRNVQEQADPVGHPEPAERRCERQEVIVVDPDQIVGPQELREPPSEGLVDRPIGLELGPAEADQPEPVMAERPERPVGEALVERSVGLPLEIEGDPAGPAAAHRPGRPRLTVHDLAAPADPDPAAPAQRIPKSDDKSPRAASLAARDADPVGYDHEPRQKASSQLFDRRMAPVISPTIE